MRRSSAYPWTYLESMVAGHRSRNMFADVSKYVMFIGQPRSGTSLVGSLLNAHPHMWIAQELNALRYVSRGYGRVQLYWLLYMKDREFGQNGRTWTGYDYAVPSQWQGRFEKLLVIGDKKAGLSSEQLGREPELLVRLQHLVMVPIRIFHIVRNPFNVITTIHRKRRRTSLSKAADMFFGRCETNWMMMQQHPEMVLTVKLEDLIAEPKDHLGRMCRFLDLTAEDSYLQACASVLFSKPRQSQSAVTWDPSLVDSVRERIEAFPFLHGYEPAGAPATTHAA